jgi:hypothetical protein
VRTPLNIILAGATSFPRPRSGFDAHTIGADQSSFSATRRGPIRAPIAGWTSCRGGAFILRKNLTLTAEHATQYAARAVADRNRTVVAVFK